MTTQAERTQLGFSIGELADLAGVTVRTLHHYVAAQTVSAVSHDEPVIAA